MDKLGKVLPGVLRRRGIQAHIVQLQVKVVFAEILGPELAACCESIELWGTTLSVETSNPAFAHQLRLDTEVLLTRLNEHLVGRRVRVLRVRTGRAPGRSGRS